jgi:DNA-3-methyladenine glycosylase
MLIHAYIPSRVGSLSNSGIATMELYKLSMEFFQTDVLTLARLLLGTYLVYLNPLEDLIVQIVETEAYLGDGTDAASHSHKGIRSANMAMFGPPGSLYIYSIYGLHLCMNIVANRPGDAVLIRAGQVIRGVEKARENRKKFIQNNDLCKGPGNFTAALGIQKAMNGYLLDGNNDLYLAKATKEYNAIVQSPRIGISRAIDLPYRFFLADNPCVSALRKKSSDSGISA